MTAAVSRRLGRDDFICQFCFAPRAHCEWTGQVISFLEPVAVRSLAFRKPPPLSVMQTSPRNWVNGKPAEVLTAVGYPAPVDGYQVNFRAPPDTAKGPASIQVSAAWIS